MLGHFERLLPPYPDPEPELPPKGFLAFVWRATTGLRGYIGLMALLSAGTSIYDALLFALLGLVVDWLGAVAPGQLWAERGGTLLLLAALLLAGGMHVTRDMAGDAPESWQSRLTAAGFTVRTDLRGLGEYPAFRALYLRRLQELIG